MSNSPIIPTGIGIPPGGLADQVVSKIDGVDYNVKWSDPGGQVNTVVGGTDITVDATDPINPIINFTGTIPPPGGQVDSIVGGAYITVDATDPINPTVNFTGEPFILPTNDGLVYGGSNTGGVFSWQLIPSSTGFWESTGGGNIQNNNTGSVAIQNGLFVGPTLATSVAQTAAQITSGGNMVRYDYLVGQLATKVNTTDTTVVRTTGAQTVSSKTLNACALSGSANISGLGSNTSTFVMCYNGSFMYRGPFVASAAQVRSALMQLASVTGTNTALYSAYLTGIGI